MGIPLRLLVIPNGENFRLLSGLVLGLDVPLVVEVATLDKPAQSGLTCCFSGLALTLKLTPELTDLHAMVAFETESTQGSLALEGFELMVRQAPSALTDLFFEGFELTDLTLSFHLLLVPTDSILMVDVVYKGLELGTLKWSQAL